MDLEDLKSSVYNHCLETIKERVADLKKQIDLNKQSSMQDTKSSMGDKYETGRAMAQLELDKLNSQLQENAKLIKVLDSLNPNKLMDSVDLGSLVITDGPKFFISVSLGKVELDGHEIFVISAVSPIGKTLLGKKQNDSIHFMGTDHPISHIY